MPPALLRQQQCTTKATCTLWATLTLPIASVHARRAFPTAPIFCQFLACRAGPGLNCQVDGPGLGHLGKTETTHGDRVSDGGSARASVRSMTIQGDAVSFLLDGCDRYQPGTKLATMTLTVNNACLHSLLRVAIPNMWHISFTGE